MTRARPRRAGPSAGVVGALTLALACTPFTGAQRADAGHDAGSDAGSDARSDAADVAPDRPPPPDAPRVCGVDYGTCDPLSDTGCPAGQTCVVTNFLTLDIGCRAPGDAHLFAECRREGDCVAGAHCVDGRCLRLCCALGGDGLCGERVGEASRCAVSTQSTVLSACTLPGGCRYPSNEGCPAGSGCNPTSLVGEPICAPFGVVAVGGQCMAQNDCVEGATCASGPAGSAGTCRALCDPTAGSACPSGGQCQGFADRPRDWGWCGR